jgi:hypothetical protein
MISDRGRTEGGAYFNHGKNGKEGGFINGENPRRNNAFLDGRGRIFGFAGMIHDQPQNDNAGAD